MDAITRSKGILGRADDVLVPASVIGRGRYSERLLAAIDHGLAFAETDRPQSVAEWRREIVGEPVTEQRSAAPAGTHTASSPAGALATAPALPPVSPQPRPKRSFPLTAIAWSIGVIAAAAIGIAVLVQLDKQNILITSQGALIKELQDKKRPEEPAEKPRAPEPPREGPPVTPLDVTSKPVEPLKPQADKPRTEAKPPPKQAVAVIPSDKPTVPKRPPDEPRRQLPDTQPSIAPPEAQSLAPQKIVPGEEKLAEAKPAPPDPMTEADQLEARGDHAGAFKILRALAEQGNARAQARVGNAYSQGRGVPRDDALAVTWYRRAAEQREGEAMLNLGHHYDQGRGIAKDLSYAYIWYSLALRAGVKAAEEPRRKAHAQLQPAQIAQLDRLIEHRGRPQ